jgi:hypothetical protein
MPIFSMMAPTHPTHANGLTNWFRYIDKNGNIKVVLFNDILNVMYNIFYIDI